MHCLLFSIVFVLVINNVTKGDFDVLISCDKTKIIMSAEGKSYELPVINNRAYWYNKKKIKMYFVLAKSAEVDSGYTVVYQDQPADIIPSSTGPCWFVMLLDGVPDSTQQTHKFAIVFSVEFDALGIGVGEPDNCVHTGVVYTSNYISPAPLNSHRQY